MPDDSMVCSEGVGGGVGCRGQVGKRTPVQRCATGGYASAHVSSADAQRTARACQLGSIVPSLVMSYATHKKKSLGKGNAE